MCADAGYRIYLRISQFAVEWCVHTCKLVEVYEGSGGDCGEFKGGLFRLHGKVPLVLEGL